MLHKKTTIVSILNILKQYTDENHRLSQKEIAEILEREYGMRVDRKAIKRNLSSLIDAGYDIECSQTTRMIKNKDGSLTESTILSDFYLERDLRMPSWGCWLTACFSQSTFRIRNAKNW